MRCLLSQSKVQMKPFTHRVGLGEKKKKRAAWLQQRDTFHSSNLVYDSDY